jgi:hypothetical protein
MTIVAYETGLSDHRTFPKSGNLTDNIIKLFKNEERITLTLKSFSKNEGLFILYFNEKFSKKKSLRVLNLYEY